MLFNNRDIGAIFIDSISAYLGKINSHNNADVRALLANLTKLAEKYNVAIICISHFNKSNSFETISRITGSVAFVAASRATFSVIKHPHEEDKSYSFL